MMMELCLPLGISATIWLECNMDAGIRWIHSTCRMLQQYDHHINVRDSIMGRDIWLRWTCMVCTWNINLSPLDSPTISANPSSATTGRRIALNNRLRISLRNVSRYSNITIIRSCIVEIAGHMMLFRLQWLMQMVYVLMHQREWTPSGTMMGTVTRPMRFCIHNDIYE